MQSRSIIQLTFSLLALTAHSSKRVRLGPSRTTDLSHQWISMTASFAGRVWLCLLSNIRADNYWYETIKYCKLRCCELKCNGGTFLYWRLEEKPKRFPCPLKKRNVIFVIVSDKEEEKNRQQVVPTIPIIRILHLDRRFDEQQMPRNRSGWQKIKNNF